MRLATLVLALAVASALACWAPERMFRKVAFQPSKGRWLGLEALQIDGEETWIRTGEGLRLHAYWVRSPNRVDRALLFLHGNAGHAGHRLPDAALLAGLDIDVLLLDYRGYGLSEGEPSERGLYADAEAALLYLQEERGVPLERVVVFGRSLGGAPGVELARRHAVAGLILEASFSSAADVARASFGHPIAWFVGRRLDSASKIAELRAPLLALHGDRDAVIPIELGRKLFAAAPEPKEFVVIPNAGHHDLPERGGARYRQTLRSFLDRVAPFADPDPPAP